jgi:hypothetical protein
MNRHYSPAAAPNEAQNEKYDSVCPAMILPLPGVCVGLREKSDTGKERHIWIKQL